MNILNLNEFQNKKRKRGKDSPSTTGLKSNESLSEIKNTRRKVKIPTKFFKTNDIKNMENLNEIEIHINSTDFNSEKNSEKEDSLSDKKNKTIIKEIKEVSDVKNDKKAKKDKEIKLVKEEKEIINSNIVQSSAELLVTTNSNNQINIADLLWRIDFQKVTYESFFEIKDMYKKEENTWELEISKLINSSSFLFSFSRNEYKINDQLNTHLLPNQYSQPTTTPLPTQTSKRSKKIICYNEEDNTTTGNTLKQ